MKFSVCVCVENMCSKYLFNGNGVCLLPSTSGVIMDKYNNKSANALALCHPPSASFCSVLAGQWSSRIFTHDRYNIEF